jgi:hypothetical protein
MKVTTTVGLVCHNRAFTTSGDPGIKFESAIELLISPKEGYRYASHRSFGIVVITSFTRPFALTPLKTLSRSLLIFCTILAQSIGLLQGLSAAAAKSAPPRLNPGAIPQVRIHLVEAAILILPLDEEWLEGRWRSVIAHPNSSALALPVPQIVASISARLPGLDKTRDVALGVDGGAGVGALGGIRDARRALDVVEMLLDEKGAKGEREQILAVWERI